MRARRYIFAIIFIIIITGIYFSLNYQSPVNKGENSPASKVDKELEQAQPTDQFKDIKLVLFSKDRPVSWELISDRVESFTGDGLLNLSSVRIKATGDSEEKEKDKDKVLYSISAQQGNYSQEKGKLKLNGPVIVNREEIQMELGQLEYGNNGRLISGRDGVRIESPHFILTGSSLTAELDLGQVTVSGDENRQAYFNWKKGE